MQLDRGIRRVILVVLDGLRPDAIDAFDLVQIRHAMTTSAWSLGAQTVDPSVTAAAMTSLMTGVHPDHHGITSERILIPKTNLGLSPLPELLARHGLPSSAFMGGVAPIFRGLASRVARRLGFGVSRFVGQDAAGILESARQTLEAQQRGLIVLHWPDADRAGHAHGWMSEAYAEGCALLDGAFGMLVASIGLVRDPGTIVVAVADHGGGGTDPRDHESDHPLDRTIPLIITGPSVARRELPSPHLVDVPPTILAALGIDRPSSYEGRALSEAFMSLEVAGAVA